jgi:acyl-CoA synthetase (AMP-forming)/AMP-acid ligase II
VVFGSPDTKWGEAVTAVIRLRDGEPTDAAELEQWLRARLAGYQVPKRIDIVTSELPKNSSGKVLRQAVRDDYWRDHDRLIG